MELSILFSGNSPKYVQIYEEIKQAILMKKLSAHEQLPSKRMLANTLNVSVHTIKEAYVAAAHRRTPSAMPDRAARGRPGVRPP